MKKAIIKIKTWGKKAISPTIKSTKEVTVFTETPDFYINLTTQEGKGIEEKTDRKETNITITFPDGFTFTGNMHSLQMHLFPILRSDKIFISWDIDDIVWRAKERGIYLHTNIAKNILSLLKSEHDCNIGINWEVIDIRTDNEDLSMLPYWNNTEIPESITCIDDVAKFLYVLFEKYGVMYNSGDSFESMINIETSSSTFTAEKAQELELIHDECLKICENYNWDIDELATMVEEIWQKMKVN